ncbi:VOC family protein [Lentzea californiensis]|uniref:VOC family protein n=1 Tax=Lentzea californiensis TaxID=438851 RepID=UPI0021657D93|nr:VOC family protein [Lentzea californiensis]MCR3750103.1 Glyoxalase-like domain-containing protein [Lentzea californiensis]
MDLSWGALTIDSENPLALARWWAESLGWEVASKNEEGVEIHPPEARWARLFFYANSDRKVVKNRLHLDLYADDLDEALANLLARGAKRVDIGQGCRADSIVLCDPEGNEFCLLLN